MDLPCRWSLALSLFSSVLLATTAHAAPRDSKDPEGQEGYGLVVQSDFSLTTLRIAASGDVTQSFGIEGGLFVGYKMERLILGLGLDLQRITIADTTSGIANGVDSSVASTTLTIAPGVQFALMRSRDKRVELYAALDVGWVHFFSSREPAPMPPNGTTSTESLSLRLGPGLRYWLHPSFALQISPTLRGLYRWTTMRSSDGTQSATQAVGLTTIDASIGFLAVF